MIRQFHIQPAYNKALSCDFEMDLDRFNPSEDWILEHFRHGVCYEQEVSHVMMRTLRPGDFAIDVGANVGFFTLLMSKLVGPAGQVLAFEPGDNTLPVLKKNMALNKVENVKLIEQPLWCREEEVTFYHSADSSGGNSLWDPGLWKENVRSQVTRDSKRVMATTLDSKGFSMWPRLIKLDTEGVEEKILEGAKDLLTWHCPYIVLELNPFGMKQFGGTNESLRSYLRQFGYECFLIHNDGMLPALIPPKTTITHQGDVAVMNVLFSTLDAVGEAWKRVPYE